MDITPQDAKETKALGIGQRITIAIGIVGTMLPALLAAFGGLDYIVAHLPLLLTGVGSLIGGGITSYVAIHRMRIDAGKATLILLLLMPSVLMAGDLSESAIMLYGSCELGVGLLIILAATVAAFYKGVPMGKLGDKIRKKVAAKTAKTKEIKPAVKAKVATALGLIAFVFSTAMLTGCATQPSRAQTATIKADSITVVDGRSQAAASLAAYFASNAVPADTALEMVKAFSTLLPAGGAGGDFALISQAMAIETGGSESNSQTSTPTTTTPIDVMRGTGGGSTWTELGTGLKSLLGLDKADAAAPAATAKDAAASDCADGSCTVTK
jgi:hypothetical protein